jgi:hypothetical protein
LKNLEIDDIKLIQKKVVEETGAVKLIGSIHNLQISDQRNIIEHQTTGAQGGTVQDQGRYSTKVAFKGTFIGEDSKTSIEQLRSIYKSGTPVQILSDISGIAEINQVLIEDLQITEEIGFNQQYRYFIQVKEYVEPAQEDEPPPDQEKEAEEETETEAEKTEKSVNYITGKVIDSEDNPMQEVTVKISWENGELSVKTDKDGIYKTDELEPGKYQVTVDFKGYEDIIENVEIN